MLSGVWQSCSLNPILFNLAIDSFERGAGDSGEVADEKVSILAYADDVTLVAASPTSMEELLSAAEERGSWDSRPILACVRLSISGQKDPNSFQMAGQQLPVMEQGTLTSALESPRGFASTKPSTAPSRNSSLILTRSYPLREDRDRISCRVSTICSGVEMSVKHH